MHVFTADHNFIFTLVLTWRLTDTSPDSPHAKIIWHLSLVVEFLITSSTTHPGIRHLKPATLLSSVSSHLLSWHRERACRSTASSHCALVPAKLRARPLFTDRCVMERTEQTGHL